MRIYNVNLKGRMMDFKMLMILIFLGLVIGGVLAWRAVHRKERQRREAGIQHWLDRKGLTRYPGE